MPSSLTPPIDPMLARLARELPIGEVTYEPKWDGFRCIAFVDSERIELQSRHGRPLGRYFPEVVAAFEALARARAERGLGALVIDGEILLRDASDTGVEFAQLMSRLHPAASRVDTLSREHPARYVAFDLLADGEEDLRRVTFPERRARLVAALRGAPAGIEVTEVTREPAIADRWLDGAHELIDGVVAKPDQLLYEPGRRAMIKVKPQRTADCVVAGMRLLGPRTVSSLILGLYDRHDELRHVGVVTQLSRQQRVETFERLRPLAMPIESHPWRDGFALGASPLGRLKGSAARWTPAMPLDWVPLEPEVVAEVGFDQVDVDRFRHPARFLRWRPDREPRSCRLDQVAREVSS